MAACSAAGTTPPVVFLVQGSSVRKVASKESTALHVTMMVLVDMHVAPVYLNNMIIIHCVTFCFQTNNSCWCLATATMAGREAVSN